MKKITLEIPDDVFKKIKESKQKDIDINTDILAMIGAGIKKRNINIAAEKYKKGSISLWKASEIANVSIHEMLDIVHSHQKAAININKSLLEKEVKNIEKSITKMKVMLTEMNTHVKYLKTQI
ncbi:hypothetical protein BEH94_08885 [Candidatus Altiarchaeales archaeon WOR_SM1_SCG]|nr:hypothetical protein BEH94_08885 [Candidatus Altiarchaeales archaeon WOR_SM1_SCG]